ncbi:MAG: hypothetical protein IJK66_02675 [Bacilli bacterium]|nr:hypothetical protein [Bacillota bacterium]MBQ6282427.1 hypothetical protein [Bacilli bacterium]
MRELTPEQLKYYEENNHKQNIMIVLLIVIIVLLAILCVYFTFFNRRMNEDNELITKKIDSQFEDISYISMVINGVSHDEIIMQGILKHTKGKDVIASKFINISSMEESTIKLGEELGFSKEQIDRIDITLWERMIKEGTDFTIYDKKDVTDTIAKLYNGYKHNLNFDNSICIDMSVGIACYDKNIEKLIYHKSVDLTQNSSIMLPKIILNKEINNDVYKISFMQTYYKFEEDENEDYCYIVDKDNYRLSVDCIDEVNDLTTIEKYEKLHEDEMPKYEVSFKINDNSYEFIDVKRIN